MKHLFFLVFGFFALVSAVKAQPKSLALSEVVEAALENSPAAMKVRSRPAAMRAEGIAQNTLPNPELDAELKFPLNQDPGGTDDEASISVSQPLKFSHFGARGQVNQLISQSSEAAEAAEILELSQRLRLQYGKLWVLSERKEQLKSLSAAAQSLSHYVEKGVQQGLFSKGEAAVFRSEDRRLQAERLGLIADLEIAKTELTKESGLNIEGATLIRPVFGILPDVGLETESNIPAQLRAELLSKLAQEQSRAARLDSYPAFAPRLIYEHSSDGVDFLGVGLSVELPLFNRNQGELLRAAADERAARSAAAYYTGAPFKAELLSLQRSLKALADQQQIFERQVVPSLEEALASYQSQLKAGQATILQSWQTFRALNEARTQAAELFVKRLAQHVELSIVLGREI